MDFFKLAALRQSVRQFKNEAPSRNEILQILEAGRLAPSAVNYQPWQIVVADAPHLRQQLWEAYPRDWFKAAPVVLVICGNHTEAWKRGADQKDHCDIDAAILTDHLSLMAASIGIGTCWVCNFNPEKVREALQLPEHMEPMVLLPLGYPATPLEAGKKRRKPLEEIVFHNGLSRPY